MRNYYLGIACVAMIVMALAIASVMMVDHASVGYVLLIMSFFFVVFVPVFLCVLIIKKKVRSVFVSGRTTRALARRYERGIY